MSSRTRSPQCGISLIELILFIVIIGVGLAGITVTYNTVVRRSADPMVRKQALAIAESLLLEIEQQAFTWCDPQDANVVTATSAAGCAVAANNQNNVGGPTPASETREMRPILSTTWPTTAGFRRRAAIFWAEMRSPVTRQLS